MNRIVQRARRFVAICLALGVIAVVGSSCAGSNPIAGDTQPTTTSKYLINPLEPGQGYVQLGANRYAFENVICATGPVKSDPEGSTRIFGVYANFTTGGKLAAVSLTRYRSEFVGKNRSVPTITDTAMIRMQGDGEVLGLKAQRARIVGQRLWHDIFDNAKTTQLITRKADRYEASGSFGPVDAAVVGDPTTTTAASGSSLVRGEIAARCPTHGATVTTQSSTPSTSSAVASNHSGE